MTVPAQAYSSRIAGQDSGDIDVSEVLPSCPCSRRTVLPEAILRSFDYGSAGCPVASFLGAGELRAGYDYQLGFMSFLHTVRCCLSHTPLTGNFRHG